MPAGAPARARLSRTPHVEASMTSLDLKERVAVVTGGASGIGRRIAEQLRDHGAAVEVWDLGDAQGLVTTRVDVSNEAAVATAAEATLARSGPVHILVCSAGILGAVAPVEQYRLVDWETVLRVNLAGMFLACRALIPSMRKAGWGRIVTIASIAGKEGTPNCAAYSASKAGIIAFTKALGKELAGSGVLANCLAPGAIETPILGGLTPEAVAALLAKCPLGRLGTVDEVAALALWLCSEACTFNTGAVFDLSGGRATY
jgi:2-dehydro-3-deoxy-L-rhamnonate dehydrogenase (NAD+)